MIKEIWVHWVEGFATFDEEDVCRGVYIASSVSQVNGYIDVIGILNSNEESSRSWFRASSFIKLNKNQLDAPLF
jgi:hypothetical protein